MRVDGNTRPLIVGGFEIRDLAEVPREMTPGQRRDIVVGAYHSGTGEFVSSCQVTFTGTDDLQQFIVHTVIDN